MARKWTDDAELLERVAGNLTDMLAVFPKRLLKVEELVREFDLPLSHLQMMILLSGGDDSIGSLSRRMGIAKPNITPMVDLLSEKGLVERIRSDTDRRVVNAHLTEEGKALLCRVQEGVARQVKAWPVSFGRSEIKEINAALATLLRLAQTLG